MDSGEHSPTQCFDETWLEGVGCITPIGRKTIAQLEQMRLLARCMIGHAAAFGDQTAEVGPLLQSWPNVYRIRVLVNRQYVDN